MLFSVFFFFFSSRRRHTRWTGDWSSDVCSSDLPAVPERDDRLLEGAAELRGDEAVEPSAQPIEGNADRGAKARSEERRVGKEGGSRGSAGQEEERGEGGRGGRWW